MTDPTDTEALLKLAREAKERADKATALPWHYCGANEEDGCPCGLVWSKATDRIVLATGGDTDLEHDDANKIANGRFAASARSDVPALANGIEALAKENARLAHEFSESEEHIALLRIGELVGVRPRESIVDAVRALRDDRDRLDCIVASAKRDARRLTEHS